MKKNNTSSVPVFWIILSIVLIIPAFLINLGIHPFIEDEAIRATVAMEMMYSDNYILPTNNGEPYLYKPPLYNWVLVLVYTITGTISEWSTRLPTVIFLGIFALVVYRSHRPYFDKTYSILAAFIYLTCGRVLFWDGFLGLIDISYSLLTYGMMIYAFSKSKEKKYTNLYTGTYLMTAAGFLMKGYPSFVFLVATLFATVVYTKKWKYIFHPAHILGMTILAGILGIYYYVLGLQIPLSETVTPLLDQSTRRTILSHDISEVIGHIIVYPFENIYHFFPWTLLAIFLFRKGFLSLLRINALAYFSAICFLTNILVYWISPEVYPRYILMLVPLAFTAFLHFYQVDLYRPTWREKTWKVMVVFLIAASGVTMYAGCFISEIEVFWQKVVLAISGSFLFFLVYAYRKWAAPLPWLLVVSLLVIRIVFNLIIIPIRAEEDDALIAKLDAEKIIQLHGEKSICVSAGTQLDRTSTFYLENYYGGIIGYADNCELYVTDIKKNGLNNGERIIDSLYIRRHEQTYYIIER